jgi:hypothetical protein
MKNTTGEGKMIKDSFILYTSFYEPIKDLSNEQKGILLTAIFEYQMGNEPDIEDGMVLMAFRFMRNQFELDKRKYAEKVEKNRENGKLGGAPTGNNNRNNQTVENQPKTSERLKINPNDNDNDNDNENENENDINKFPPSENQPAPKTPPENKTDPTPNGVDPCNVLQTGIIKTSESQPVGEVCSKTEIVPVSQSPPANKSRKKELTPEQMQLYHAAKLCFETSEKAKAIMYADDTSAKIHMDNLKSLVIRCSKMAPGITADFMKNVLEHFRIMTNGKLKGKAAFTPRCLITPWVWETVIDSLPENEVDEELRECVRGLFK